MENYFGDNIKQVIFAYRLEESTVLLSISKQKRFPNCSYDVFLQFMNVVKVASRSRCVTREEKYVQRFVGTSLKRELTRPGNCCQMVYIETRVVGDVVAPSCRRNRSKPKSIIQQQQQFSNTTTGSPRRRVMDCLQDSRA